jgi:hypothetical protein
MYIFIIILFLAGTIFTEIFRFFFGFHSFFRIQKTNWVGFDLDGTLASYSCSILHSRMVKKHIGQKLEVTCVKDFKMKLLYDDRAIQVKKNTGKCVTDY